MRKLMKLLALPFLTLLLTSCLGSTSHVVFVKTYDSESGKPLVVGRISRNVRVPVVFEDTDGKQIEQPVDVGGWGVIHPNAIKQTKPVMPKDRPYSEIEKEVKNATIGK